jgi:hypothetical protein
VNASAATVQRDDLTELDVAEILERDAEAEVRDARPRPDMKDVVSCFPVVVEVGAAASLCLLGHHEGQAGTVERDQSRRAISVFVNPSAAYRTIFARCTTSCGSV